MSGGRRAGQRPERRPKRRSARAASLPWSYLPPLLPNTASRRDRSRRYCQRGHKKMRDAESARRIAKWAQAMKELLREGLR